jgi:phage baseplate assembly protein W
MRLAFGGDLASFVGRPLVPRLLLDLYRAAIVVVHRWEPEYRIKRVDITRIERTGALGLSHRGVYYPEGRFGNYAQSEPAQAVTSFAELRP